MPIYLSYTTLKENKVMKKTISILLIITMLLSMIVVSAVPAFAAESTVETVGANKDTCGNTLEPGANTDTYKDNENWTAISTYEELAAMEKGKSYYLTADITMSASIAKVPYVTLDGNGYKIITTAPVFDHTSNVTVKNLTVDATLNHEDNGYLTALARWTSHEGWTKIHNCTFNVSITSVKNTYASQKIAGVTINAMEGSEFKNVLVNADILVEGEEISQLNGVAGIVGMATATAFENCIVNGSIEVNAKDAFKNTGDNDNGVAGLVGRAIAPNADKDGCSFKNCTNNLDIIMNAPAFAGKTTPAEGETARDVACNNLGGIAGFSMNAKYENCRNAGDVTLGAKATGWRVGGIVGHNWNKLTMNTVKNTGSLSCAAADIAGGIVGFSNYSTTAIKDVQNDGAVFGKNYAGGIIGYAVGNYDNSVEITNCQNSGAIKSTAVATGAIVGSSVVSGGLKISNAFNYGALTAGTAENCAVAAIVGTTENTRCEIKNCMNIGVITGGNAAHRSPLVTGTKITLTNCLYFDATIKGETANTNGTALDEAATLRTLEKSKLFVDKEDLVACIDRLSVLSEEYHSYTSWKNMIEKLGLAKEVNDIKLFTIKNGTVVFADMAELQAKIDEVTPPLIAAERLLLSKAYGANAKTAGNVIEPGSKTEEYSKENSGWTAISSWKEFENKVKAGGKFYFTNDITATSMLDIVDKLDGTVIDGNGYTLTATNPLFQHTKNTTLRNLTLDSTLSGIAAGATPLAYWETKGATKVYNVTVNSTINVGANTSGSQCFSGFMIYAQSGSVLKDVVVNTTLTLDNSGLTKANSIGTIVARAENTLIENCIANGTITVKQNAFKDNNLGNSGIGGIVGNATINSKVQNCTSNVAINVNAPALTNCVSIGGIAGTAGNGALIQHCISNSDITLGESATGWQVGGIVGRTYNGTVTINVCQNNGSISCEAADYAGGIVGHAYMVNTNINQSENSGNVSNNGYAGGVAGYVTGDTFKTLQVSRTRNIGNISSKSSCAGGLVGGAKEATLDEKGTILVNGCLNSGKITAGTAVGIANCGNLVSEIKNSISIGTVAGESVAPIAIGLHISVIECSYLKSGIPEVVANEFGTAIDLAGALRAVEATEFFICKADFSALLFSVVNYKKDYYNASEWGAFEEKLNAAKAVDEMAIFTITDGVVTFADNLKELQALVNEAYGELLSAKSALTLTPKTRTEVKNAIDEADKLIADNAGVIYTTDSWERFASALAALKVIYNRANDPGDVAAALTEMSEATAGLTKGGVISSAEYFATLAGQEGEFTLDCDITVTQSVSSFKGTLVGNGHTVTLDGCALFDELDGATISDLKVVGKVGGAESVMGKASGKITLRNIVINTDKLSVASLFDEADENAKISVVNAIILSDAGVGAIVGDVNCAVLISNALVMADAPALTGSVNETTSAIESSYLNGKVFINEIGSVCTDAKVFASGEVAFFMNEILAAVSSQLTDFADTYLVQVIGADALPTIGAAAIDGTNVVEKYYDADGNLLGYRNVTGDASVEEDEDNSDETAIDLAGLEAAIKNAEALKEADYTAKSFATLKAALIIAKDALEAAKSQADVDSAASALNDAISALVKVEVKVENKIDYSKLYLVLDKVSVLKQEDYSAETWGNLEAMLTLAIMAKEATTQKAVDEAVAGLESAIKSLKAPVVENEAPTVENETSDTTTESGCGSVIGGVAVVFTAMIALAGISLKKKED